MFPHVLRAAAVRGLLGLAATLALPATAAPAALALS